MRQAIENAMEMKGISNSELARRVNVKPNRITKLFKENFDPNKNSEPDFSLYLDIVRTLTPDKEREMMAKYFNYINQPKNLKKSIEYTNTHRYKEEFLFLLDKASKMGNATLQEWVQIYSFHNNHNRETRKKHQFLMDVRHFNVKEIELAVFSKILEAQHYFYNNQYRVLNQLMIELEDMMTQLAEDDYLVYSYKARYAQIKSYTELKVNQNLDGCRKYAKWMIDADIGFSYDAFGNYLSGLSYLFEDYQQSYAYLKRSRDIYLNNSHDDAANNVVENLDLLNFYWNKEGSNSTYNNILRDKKVEINIDDQSTALDFFTFGIIEKSTSVLMRSLARFIQEGDAFLANLPKTELVKMGMDVNVINDIMKIHQTS